MKTGIYSLILMFASFLTVQAQTKWNLDPAHSKIGFSVTHLVISEVEGDFKKYEADITSSKEDFSDLAVTLKIDAASINTENEKRDEHLRAEDFFHTSQYPEIIFKSKSFKKTGKNKYKLTGDFTMRGVTKHISLDVVHNGTVVDPWGNTKAGFKLTGKINRFDYGLKWNNVIEAGGAVVGKEVRFNINIQIAKSK